MRHLRVKTCFLQNCGIERQIPNYSIQHYPDISTALNNFLLINTSILF